MEDIYTRFSLIYIITSLFFLIIGYSENIERKDKSNIHMYVPSNRALVTLNAKCKKLFKIYIKNILVETDK